MQAEFPKSLDYTDSGNRLPIMPAMVSGSGDQCSNVWKRKESVRNKVRQKESKLFRLEAV